MGYRYTNENFFYKNFRGFYKGFKRGGKGVVNLEDWKIFSRPGIY